MATMANDNKVENEEREILIRKQMRRSLRLLSVPSDVSSGTWVALWKVGGNVCLNGGN